MYVNFTNIKATFVVQNVILYCLKTRPKVCMCNELYKRKNCDKWIPSVKNKKKTKTKNSIKLYEYFKTCCSAPSLVILQSADKFNQGYR